MARDGAEPNAYEYTGKGSPNASDNDEDTNVEPNASITKLLTTQGSRDSNESTNADAEDISAMDTMEYILPTLRVRQESSSECPLDMEDGNRKTLTKGAYGSSLALAPFSFLILSPPCTYATFRWLWRGWWRRRPRRAPVP